GGTFPGRRRPRRRCSYCVVCSFCNSEGGRVSTTTPLRERRRSATRQEIHHAAVALVLERGLAGVTVEEIAEAAGVSPRTFFNYFPTKRDALVTGPPAMPEPLLAQ